ncbi:MAG: PaaI family thioesterase, partial [Chloroflexi bacterium]|nr:PaaI family thioesterase [Chloroflexota bacterium]
MKKQPNSRHCFLCGVQNPIGLKLTFYEDEENRVSARFVPGEEHQGYPGVLHGGITCALLDETIGRTLVRDDIWAMTVELNVRFRQPIPLGQPLTVIGEMVRLRSRTMEGRGQIILADGTVAATAEAKYIRLSDEQVSAFRNELGYWQVMPDDE